MAGEASAGLLALQAGQTGTARPLILEPPGQIHANALTRWSARSAKYDLTAMSDSAQTPSSAANRYLLLADISGYTAFMNGFEEAHGVDFSDGIPAGFAILGALLDAVLEGVQPEFEIAKLEGDAVFAVAPADTLDGHGAELLTQLQTVYHAFLRRRAEDLQANDHLRTACPAVAGVDLATLSPSLARIGLLAPLRTVLR
jgi:hypothetical protein